MNKRRVLSIILGVCISLMMVGTAFAAQSFTIKSGNNGTYVKGSKTDYVITVQVDECTAATNDLYLTSLKVGDHELSHNEPNIEFVTGEGVYPTTAGWPTDGIDSHTITGDVTIKSSYLDTLQAGTYDVELKFNYPSGTVNTTIEVKDTAASPSASPSVDPSKTPAAGTTEATTTPSKDANGKNPQTGDDTSGIMGFAVAAILSGAALVVLGRKKVFK